MCLHTGKVQGLFAAAYLQVMLRQVLVYVKQIPPNDNIETYLSCSDNTVCDRATEATCLKRIFVKWENTLIELYKNHPWTLAQSVRRRSYVAFASKPNALLISFSIILSNFT